MLFQLISIFIVLVIDCIQVNESLIKKIRRRLLLKKKKEAELLELFKKKIQKSGGNCTEPKIWESLEAEERGGEEAGRKLCGGPVGPAGGRANAYEF